MHLPYIAKTLGKDKTSLVPVMVGPVDEEMALNYADIFRPYFEQPENLFIFSTDFCHWGSRFGYTYTNEAHGQIWQSIEKLDGEGMNYIQNHDLKGFLNYLKSTKNTVCGSHPLTIFLALMQITKTKGLKTKFVKYAQS